MFIDASNPMQDALETIRATDVISDAKKHALCPGNGSGNWGNHPD